MPVELVESAFCRTSEKAERRRGAARRFCKDDNNRFQTRPIMHGAFGSSGSLALAVTGNDRWRTPRCVWSSETLEARQTPPDSQKGSFYQGCWGGQMDGRFCFTDENLNQNKQGKSYQSHMSKSFRSAYPVFTFEKFCVVIVTT